MRTEERWEKVVLLKKLKQFPLRIQHDLKKINFKKLPSKNITSTFITGGVETGKTLLACRMLLQEQKNAYLNPTKFPQVMNCIFTTVDDFTDELKRSFNDSTSTDDIIERYSNAYFLIFDDLGTQKVSEWILGILYLIINRRYENMLKTIITSNYNLSEIAETYDSRISSRIERMGETIDKKLKG